MEFREWQFIVMEVKALSILIFGIWLVQDFLYYDTMIMFCNKSMNGFMWAYDDRKCIYFDHAKYYYASNLLSLARILVAIWA
jgi:hypothetical protein